MDKKSKKDDEIKKTLSELQKQVEEYKNKYLRALADYQNLEKRVLGKEEEAKTKEKKRLLTKILSIVDDLERAEIFLKDPGLIQIKNRFYELLKSEGVKEIVVLNKEFDPQLAEAVEMVAGEKDNFIIEVVNKGYLLDDQILRVAKVKVSKKVKS